MELKSNALTTRERKRVGYGNILDIGGGLKPCYFTLKNSLPHKIKCHVIEFENIVKGSKKIYENIEDLTYSTEFPKKMNFDDFVCSQGAPKSHRGIDFYHHNDL